MEVTFLGTGTSQGVPVIACECAVCKSNDSHDKRLRSSVMITHEGKNIVIDTGPDFRYQMLRENVKDIDAVLYTHEHKDHVAGLDDIRPINYFHNKAIDLYASENVQTGLKREFHYIFTGYKYPGIPEINIIDINKDDKFSVIGLEVTPIEVLHYKLPVLGFRIGGFTYITDAKTIAPDQKEKMKNSDVLVVNALRIEEHISHFNLREALDLVAELKPKKAYFTHISHLLGKHADVERGLPENVHLSYDGLKLHL